jgi:hypothetical protein
VDTIPWHADVLTWIGKGGEVIQQGDAGRGSHRQASIDEAPYESDFQPRRKLPPPFKRLPWGPRVGASPRSLPSILKAAKGCTVALSQASRGIFFVRAGARTRVKEMAGLWGIRRMSWHAHGDAPLLQASDARDRCIGVGPTAGANTHLRLG